MTAITTDAPAARRGNWFRRAEAWIDARGTPAWVVTLVLTFIIFWPLGLALLAYLIWSNRMFSARCNTRARHAHSAFKSSGNTAFDAYKAETLRRLEDEQDAFEAFLNRLRDAKDKAQFDQFMEERTKKSDAGSAPTEA